MANYRYNKSHSFYSGSPPDGGQVDLELVAIQNVVNVLTPDQTGHAGEYLFTDGTDISWAGGGGGGGETNTASSSGGGISLYYQKTGVDLEFNAIKSENNRLTVALDGATHDVELTVNEGNIDHNALANYDANQHSDHSIITITAGVGLTGGGTIDGAVTIDADVGIGLNQIIIADVADIIDNDYAKFTADGVEGRSYSEVRSDINVADGADVTGSNAPQAHAASHAPQTGGDALTCASPEELVGVQAAAEGTSDYLARADHQHQIQHSSLNNHIVTVNDGFVGVADYARFAAGGGLEGRDMTEVRSDINVEDGADVTDATNVASAGAVMEEDFNAKGDILSASADDTPVILSVGADTQVLTADSGEASGLKWAAAGGGGGGDLLADGTVPLTANWDVGNFTITANGLTIDGAFTDGTWTISGGQVLTGAARAIDITNLNDFFGYNAGNGTLTGTTNTGVGNTALDNLTTGAGNTAVGNSAGDAATEAHESVFIGKEAGNSITVGTRNTMVGYGTGGIENGADDNVLVGHNAGGGTSNTTIGDDNVLLGSIAGGSATGVTRSVLIGYQAGRNASGSNNVAIGQYSGYACTGASSVFLGYAAGMDETGSSTLIIDNQDRASEAAGRTDSLVYGIFSATVANQYFRVNGSIYVGGSNNELRFYEGANYVGFEAPALAADQIWILPDEDGDADQALKTDGAGNLSWGDASAGGGGFAHSFLIMGA